MSIHFVLVPLMVAFIAVLFARLIDDRPATRVIVYPAKQSSGRRGVVEIPPENEQASRQHVAPAIALPPELFSLRNVTKAYGSPDGSVIPLRNVSLDIRDGSITAIVGPSGEEKSTLLNCLGGLDSPTQGDVLFRGQAIPYRDESALRLYRGLHVAWVMQELNLIGHQTAEGNVAFPLRLRSLSAAEASRRARHCLALVGIDAAKAGRRPQSLSGGERQRVAIARAFASDADVILADEPTGSLDPENARLVMSAFGRLSHDTNKPVVLVTHNLELAAQYADTVLRCDLHGIHPNRTAGVQAGVQASACDCDRPVKPCHAVDEQPSERVTSRGPK